MSSKITNNPVLQGAIGFTTAMGIYIVGSLISNKSEEKKKKQEAQNIEKIDNITNNKTTDFSLNVDKYQQLRAIPRLNNNYIDSYNVSATIQQPLITIER